MIRSVRLQNWASFGVAQTAPLEAITVLVGANNSGKSNFLRALHGFDVWPTADAVHRPASSPAIVHRALTADVNGRALTWEFRLTYERSVGLKGGSETLSVDGVRRDVNAAKLVGDKSIPQGERDVVQALVLAQQQSRLVHLKADAIRLENLLRPVALQHDGSELAAVIARWTLELPEKLEEFNAILWRCLPEMKRVHAPPAQQPGHVRLVFEQKDGERFDASEVSDGVVLFAALIAHAVEAPEDGLVLIEEPERGLHPRRLVELLDVLRTLVEKRRTQFVLATHSPALLTLLRDEPEAILLFRRTDAGTEIRRLSDVPELAESLTRTDPGELLASGAFNEGFGGERHEAAE